MLAVQSSVSVEMLRLCLLWGFLTVLFAGGVQNSNSVRNMPVDEGDTFVIFVMPNWGDSIKTCHLTPPHGRKFEFEPYDVSASTAKYVIHGTAGGMACMITVQKIDINDDGIWVMSYDFETTSDEDNGHNAATETVNVIVNVEGPTITGPGASKEIDEDEEENEDDNITFLSVINHSARRDLSIDISLDKKSFAEECYVLPPNGALTKAKEFKMDNVTVQQSSNFVSCRITLRPMSDSLLGTWRVCGKSNQDEMRCQPANVVWNNINNPDVAWSFTTQSRFSHPVHYGGSVNPGVVGIGNAETCHVVTPNGEDLVITRDVAYPHIERIAFDRPTLCSIKFTNIDSSSIGDWIIYGKFRSWASGLNEVHLPLRFFLYNAANPYEQAYNVTTLPEGRHLVILGRTLEVSVPGLTGQVDNCQYIMPTGQSQATNGVALSSVETTPACRITFSPITKDMLGEWQLIGKFSNGNQFTERRQTFRIIQEDPANPIIDDFRTVENLAPQIFDSELGASHSLTITSLMAIENESCHILTQNGLQYAFIDGFNVPNVEIVQGNGIECGVRVNVLSLDMLGEWTLIARGTRSNNPIERRRSFTIRIEEISSLNGITITEGADLYLSLPKATYMYETCKLYGPTDEEVTDFEVDQFRYSSCGFIVKNVTQAQRGTWTIVYGTHITYKATVAINILALNEIAVEDLVWTAGTSVNVTIGPEDAVYCRLLDHDLNIVYDGFGQCRAVVDRVMMTHEGQWSISIGVPGTVMLRDGSFNVKVLPADTRPVVTTDVVKNGSSVILICSVPGENEVQACLFRDPDGNILIASHGVGQDGYTGALIRYESESDSHNCTLRLLTPSSEHQGIWRCAVDTARHTSYGFLTFTSSIKQTTNYYHTEPELKSAAYVFEGIENAPVTMSCSIDAVIRYCYYRAPNGTVYTVAPSISSADYDYVGNGLDSGECGIRFNNLSRHDSGSWSCNVGVGGKPEELTKSFDVSVYERMSIFHGWLGSSVILRLSFGEPPELEYCRFVRIDGLGFTSDNVPQEYILDLHELNRGACALTIPSPKSQDLCPWTVFAKVIGSEEEQSMTSTFYIPPSPQMTQTLVIPILLWTLFSIMCLLVILSAVSLIPKKNREWTYKRASSIRNSFKKQPLPPKQHLDMMY